MAQDVIALLFAGDSKALLPNYAEGARSFGQSGGTAPEHIVVAHSPEGLLVTLVWGDGVDHEKFGRHMLGLIGELGLPFPRVNHGTLETSSWTALTAAAHV